MDVLELPSANRSKVDCRTLEKINEDHMKFVQHGSNIKKAKYFNNCPMEALFDIPLDQVCMLPIYWHCICIVHVLYYMHIVLHAVREV